VHAFFPAPVTSLSGSAMPLLIVVPVRAGSKRLPDKHVRPLLGQTLLERTARQIAESGLSATVLLTTDSPELAEAGRRLGWSAPFLRPAALADDRASTVDAVLHALEWFRDDRGTDPEVTLLVQVTSPLRRPERLAAAVELLNGNEAFDAVVGVTQAAPSSEYLMVRSDHGLTPVRMHHQGPIYRLNGAVYAIRTRALRHHRSFVPPHTYPLEMPAAESVDVDDIQDWMLAETILARGTA